MKLIRSNFVLVIILFALAALQACKAKKLVQKPATTPVTETEKTQAPVHETKPAAPVQQPEPEVQKPNYNFVNIQFEFDSSVLRTDAYPILDQAASAMKMDTTVKFVIKGYASSEGTAAHNMTLSQDRANSVKVYLINSGVRSASLTATGYGISNPVADNSTEEGRKLNRRVEIHLQH